MSTGINIAPSSGITVGTTAVTSGTDGRVFFQAGGVVQQDANFTYDNTLKRLGLKAAGTAATDIPFAIQNSAGTRNILAVDGSNTIFYTSGQGSSGLVITPVTNGSRLYLTNNFQNITASIDGATGDLYTTSAVRLGSSAFGLVNNGGQDLSVKGADIFGAEYFNLRMYGSTNVGDYKFKTNTNTGAVFFTTSRFDGSNPFVITDAARVGIGTNSPQSRLDVRAQGALSTDIAFRVRNSADTADLVRLNGNGTHFFFNSNGTTNINFYEYGHGIWANGGSSFRIKNLNGSTNIEGATSTRFITDVTNKAITFDGRQLHIGGQALPTINGDSCIIIESGTAPTTALSDRFYLYSADITAGNAAPHFRTENGSIVKLYQETTGVAAATLVGGGGTTITDTDTFDGYTLKQIVKALRNQGLLA